MPSYRLVMVGGGTTSGETECLQCLLVDDRISDVDRLWLFLTLIGFIPLCLRQGQAHSELITLSPATKRRLLFHPQWRGHAGLTLLPLALLFEE